MSISASTAVRVVRTTVNAGVFISQHDDLAPPPTSQLRSEKLEEATKARGGDFSSWRSLFMLGPETD